MFDVFKKLFRPIDRTEARMLCARRISDLEGEKLALMMELTRLKATTISFTIDENPTLESAYMKATQQVFFDYKTMEMRNLDCHIDWIKLLVKTL